MLTPGKRGPAAGDSRVLIAVAILAQRAVLRQGTSAWSDLEIGVDHSRLSLRERTFFRGAKDDSKT